MNASQLKAYGLWHVTTEGDCEGRSIKDLGIHDGFLDEVAFALAPLAYYGLNFSPVDTSAYKSNPPLTQVNISLNIGSSMWDMPVERADFFKRLLEGRPVTVEPSSFYASVTLISGRNPVEQEQMRKEAARRTALSKLSPADMEALGLK